MNKYVKFKENLSKKLEEFSKDNIFFAFSNEQFEEWLKKINATKEDKLVTIWGWGYLKKEKANEYLNIIKNEDEEYKKFFKDDNNLFDAFKYELGNHEYIITYNYIDTLSSLGMKEKELTERELIILKSATKEYLDECE